MYNTHTEIPSGPIKYSRNPTMDLWGFARFQSTGESWHSGVCGVLLLTSTRLDSTLEREEKLGTGYVVSRSYAPASAGDGLLPISNVFIQFLQFASHLGLPGCICTHVAAAHVFQRITKGSPQCPQLTATILLLCLFRHKCYILPSSFPFQSMGISKYLLKVFPLEIKTNQNQFLKFFFVTKISIL